MHLQEGHKRARTRDIDCKEDTRMILCITHMVLCMQTTCSCSSIQVGMGWLPSTRMGQGVRWSASCVSICMIHIFHTEPQDMLLPKSRGTHEWFGLGLTLVDGIDTLLIMKKVSQMLLRFGSFCLHTRWFVRAEMRRSSVRGFRNRSLSTPNITAVVKFHGYLGRLWLHVSG